MGAPPAEPDRAAPGHHEAPRHVRLPHVHFPHLRFTHRELHDRPLAGEPAPGRRLHWKLYGCEAVATAMLMVMGIAVVVLLTGAGSPVAARLGQWPVLRTSLCGLLFGSAGTLAAMTPFGRVSGAHLSPSVSFAFNLAGRLAWVDLAGYVGAQMLGALAGTAAIWLLAQLWSPGAGMVRATHYAATLPAPGIAAAWVVGAECLATAGLVLALAWGAAHPRLHGVTPWIGGLYFCAMNPFVAWLSGDSTNFARSLGPALFDRDVSSLWIYLIGPLGGSVLAISLLRSGLCGRIRIIEARIVNFGHHGRVPRLSHPEAAAPPPASVQ